MSTETTPTVEVARWYTPALKIPKLLGKLPSGERLPGGPYRLAQAGAFFAVGTLGVLTMRWWGTGGIMTYVYLACAAFAAGWFARYIPTGTTNPAIIATGSLRLAFRPTSARWGHELVRPVGAVQVRNRIAIHPSPLPRPNTTCPPPATTSDDGANDNPAPASVVAAPAPPAAVPTAPVATPPAPAMPANTPASGRVEEKLARLLAS